MRTRCLLMLLVSTLGVCVVAPHPLAAHPTDETPDSRWTNYRWIAPPPDRADDNVVARGRRATLQAGASVTAFWTPDLQFSMTWPKDALGADAVTIEVTPLDPAEFPPLPDGFEASGNAYRLALDPIDRFGQPGRVTLVAAEPNSTIYESRDGRSWQPTGAIVDERGNPNAEIAGDGLVIAAVLHEEEKRSYFIPMTLAIVVAGGALALAAAWKRRR